jgi:hypothetical protein
VRTSLATADNMIRKNEVPLPPRLHCFSVLACLSNSNLRGQVNNINVIYHAGRVAMQFGLYEDAEKYLRKALEMYFRKENLLGCITATCSRPAPSTHPCHCQRYNEVLGQDARDQAPVIQVIVTCLCDLAGLTNLPAPERVSLLQRSLDTLNKHPIEGSDLLEANM